jgi:hypothetical protein
MLQETSLGQMNPPEQSVLSDYGEPESKMDRISFSSIPIPTQKPSGGSNPKLQSALTFTAALANPSTLETNVQANNALSRHAIVGAI